MRLKAEIRQLGVAAAAADLVDLVDTEEQVPVPDALPPAPLAHKGVGTRRRSLRPRGAAVLGSWATISHGSATVSSTTSQKVRNLVPEFGGPAGVEKVEHEEQEGEARMAEDGDFTSETDQTTAFQAKVTKAATKHGRDKRGVRLKAAKDAEGTAKGHAEEQATADWEAARAVTKSTQVINANAEVAKAAAKADGEARKIVMEMLATSGVRDAVVDVDLGIMNKEENDAKGIFPKSQGQVSESPSDVQFHTPTLVLTAPSSPPVPPPSASLLTRRPNSS